MAVETPSAKATMAPSFATSGIVLVKLLEKSLNLLSLKVFPRCFVVSFSGHLQMFLLFF